VVENIAFIAPHVLKKKEVMSPPHFCQKILKSEKIDDTFALKSAVILIIKFHTSLVFSCIPPTLCFHAKYSAVIAPIAIVTGNTRAHIMAPIHGKVIHTPANAFQKSIHPFANIGIKNPIAHTAVAIHKNAPDKRKSACTIFGFSSINLPIISTKGCIAFMTKAFIGNIALPNFALIFVICELSILCLFAS
jgi:hypothetical protein